jgi:hypothetical protein
MVLLWYATQLQTGNANVLERDFLNAMQSIETHIDKALAL